jgi:ribokinase
MRIANYGSINLDHVYTLEHIVAPGETAQARDCRLFSGGKGLNQSIALAKAGSEVWHMGVVGADGGMLLDSLRAYGVNTAHIKRIEGPSAHTVIQVDEHGQNCIIVYADDAVRFTPLEMDEALAGFTSGDALVLQNELNGSPEMMRKAADKGMRVFFNPSPYNDAVRGYPLECVSWFLLNEIEGQALTGESAPDGILAGMRLRYPDTGVVLTLGKNGAYCRYGDETLFQPAFPVRAVDTTAAGDTFTGYFITGFTRGEPLERSLKRAACAASVAVSRKGAADSVPSASELPF